MSKPHLPCLIGAGALERRNAAVARVGRASVDAALKKLPSELRESFSTITALTWVPMDELQAVQDAIADEVGMDRERFSDDLVRDGSTKAFRTIWRVMLRFTSDQALIARTPGMYARTRNVGRLASRSIGSGQGEFKLTEFPHLRPRWARDLAIGIEAVMALSGREGASVEITKMTSTTALFVGRWQS